MMTEAAYILTGSNTGNRDYYLSLARNRLNSEAGGIVFASHVYKSDPWGFESEHAFLNQVLLINTAMEPDALLDVILGIELSAGRERSEEGYEDRTLDVDILFYGSRVIQTHRLVIPHPRLHLRRFTLAPLCEIAPYFFHPVFKKTISDLYDRCEDDTRVTRL